MRSRSLLVICLLFVCFAVHADGGPEQLTSQTFLDDAQAGRVKSVEIATGYPKSEHELMVTATKDGKDVTYYVDRPFRAEDDPVFIDFLKTHQIPYKLVNREEGDFSFFFGFRALLFFFAPPIVIILMLRKVLSRMREVRAEVASLRSLLEALPARDMSGSPEPALSGSVESGDVREP